MDAAGGGDLVLTTLDCHAETRAHRIEQLVRARGLV
jgi:hypothetical protein